MTVIRFAWAAFWILALGTLAQGSSLNAQEKKYEIRLKRAWVRAHADRTSVDATMEVRHTHERPKRIRSGGDDGDIHFSGISREIGLPFVGEVVNAALPEIRPVIASLVQKEGTNQTIAISGAWRLWFEHPATRHTQGGSNRFEPDHTNPDHSFEIHPASRIDQHDLGRSFAPIPGYEAYPADVAFPFFDSCVVTVKASRSGISIRSQKLKYNYVEFDIELAADPRAVQDGFIAVARVLNDDGEEAASGHRRMVVVGGTTAAGAIGTAEAGDRLRVLGIPRVDLNRVLALVAANGTRQFDAALPYEMIIVGVL